MTPRERLLEINAALTHVAAAVERLSAARDAAERALPRNHAAAVATGQAVLVARTARATLEIVLRRLP